MHISDHGGDPAHIEVFTTRAGFSSQHFFDVTLNGRFPVALVRHIDSELPSVRRDREIFLGQAEGADLSIQSKDMDTVAESEHQLGVRTIYGITRGDLLATFLQEGVTVFQIGPFGRFEHRENGTDRNIDINIGRAIERVEYQQVLALRIAIRDTE